MIFYRPTADEIEVLDVFHGVPDIEALWGGKQARLRFRTARPVLSDQSSPGMLTWKTVPASPASVPGRGSKPSVW